jgi:type II secretory pathway component PulM
LVEVQRAIALLNQKNAWPPLSKHGERQRDRLMEALLVITAKLRAVLETASTASATAPAPEPDPLDIPGFLRREVS